MGQEELTASQRQALAWFREQQEAYLEAVRAWRRTVQASTSAASLPSPPTPANPFDLAGAMGASREFVEQVTKMQQDFFQHLTGALSAEDPSA
ncbi:MAG: hypothetical protein KDB63_08740 [Nocardioidaceae bacterium]|jgi:hypothetical protein|nr:hypothetical protein [Nocardioidaceae bacterium]